jgi:hypothetical protein
VRKRRVAATQTQKTSAGADDTFEKAEIALKNLPMCRIFVRGAVSICAVKTSCSDTNTQKNVQTAEKRAHAHKKWCKLSNTLKQHEAVGKGSNAQKIKVRKRVSRSYTHAENVHMRRINYKLLNTLKKRANAQNTHGKGRKGCKCSE